jgi:Tfp pilus assembly protein PilF
VVELENDFIKVMILPEIGGKIWAAIEKSTNQPFIYYNHVVKFRDVAMRGPWTSGGIEANYGIIGHTPNSASPVDYLIKKKEDGSVSCVIAWLDLLTRTNWSIEVNLPRDKAYFTTHSVWYNNTATEQPYYHWMNVGIKTKGNLQFIYPGTHYIGHEGEHADWPVNKTNNKHIDFYEQNNFGGYKSYHVFGKYTDFFGAYWHDDDFGMARYSLHEEKPGKKIWIWGLSQQGMIWEKLLTDTDGQYAEIQSGRLFNQNAEGSSLTPFKHVSFEPYATDEWTEYWYPVLHTKGFVKANELGAVNARFENGWLKINFSPVQVMNDSLIVKDKGRVIYSKLLQLTPLKPFADSIKSAADPAGLEIVIGSGKFIYNGNPRQDELSRPLDAPADFNWNTAYGNYIAGKEFMDQRLYVKADDKLQQSLKLDSNFLPSLCKMAELYYHNMEYGKALTLVKRALSIDTHDGDANYYYGLVNAQSGNYTDAKDGFDLAALIPAYRAAAYTALSKLYLLEKNYPRATIYADKALYYNAGNTTAYKLKAIIARKEGDKNEAIKAQAALEKLDPLNHFSSFEKWLWSHDATDKKNFIAPIQNELAYQTFLELSIDYYNLGCADEAMTMLELAPVHALVNYWKGFLQFKAGKPFASFISEGDNNPPAFVLPFRSESEEMLKWVITQSASWKPKYYLALLYRDRNRLDESRIIMNAIADEPGESFFYASRAALQKEDAEREKDMLKANQLDKNEWRYVKKLSELYLAKRDNARALAFTEPYYKSHRGNYIIGMAYTKALLANRRYADAGKLLLTINIIPFEGATDGRELYRQAMLMQALQNIKAKKWPKALDYLSKAKQFPDNLGSGRPYEEDIDYRVEDYLTAIVYEKSNKKEESDKLFRQVASYPETRGGTKSTILIQAWALQRLGDSAAATGLVERKLSGEKNEPLKKWMLDVLNNPAKSLQPGTSDDTSLVLPEAIRELGNQ